MSEPSKPSLKRVLLLGGKRVLLLVGGLIIAGLLFTLMLPMPDKSGQGLARQEESRAPEPPTIPSMTVCEARTAAVGQTIIVTGEFYGAGANTFPTLIILSEMCGPSEAASVHAEMVSHAEFLKVTANKRTRPRRPPLGRGDDVTIQGVVGKAKLSTPAVQLTGGLAR